MNTHANSVNNSQWWRWLLVPLAAVGAFVAAQLIWVLTPMPDIIVRLCSSWSCPLAAIIAAAMTAPKGKFYVALIFSILFAAVSGAVAVYEFPRLDRTAEKWEFGIGLAIGLMAAFVACAIFRERDAGSDGGPSEPS